jgi:hypothetical protein
LPGTASRIAVTHVRGGWRISWRPGANATAQQLTIRFIDGEQALLAATAAQRDRRQATPHTPPLTLQS